MWETTPHRNNNNRIAQLAPQSPGQADTPYTASSHQIGVWSEARLFARLLVVSGVRRQHGWSIPH
jgi:hypothetical protein